MPAEIAQSLHSVQLVQSDKSKVKTFSCTCEAKAREYMHFQKQMLRGLLLSVREMDEFLQEVWLNDNHMNRCQGRDN
jgi:hypothetical protein